MPKGTFIYGVLNYGVEGGGSGIFFAFRRVSYSDNWKQEVLKLQGGAVLPFFHIQNTGNGHGTVRDNLPRIMLVQGLTPAVVQPGGL